MTNPLENRMKDAETKMAIENLREMMGTQLGAVALMAKIQAAHFKALIEEGVGERAAAIIVAIHYKASKEGEEEL